MAVKEKLTKDSGVAGAGHYDHIVEKLLEKPKARGMYIVYVGTLLLGSYLDILHYILFHRLNNIGKNIFYLKLFLKLGHTYVLSSASVRMNLGFQFGELKQVSTFGL